MEGRKEGREGNELSADWDFVRWDVDSERSHDVENTHMRGVEQKNVET